MGKFWTQWIRIGGWDRKSGWIVIYLIRYEEFLVLMGWEGDGFSARGVKAFSSVLAEGEDTRASAATYMAYVRGGFTTVGEVLPQAADQVYRFSMAGLRKLTPKQQERPFLFSAWRILEKGILLDEPYYERKGIKLYFADAIRIYALIWFTLSRPEELRNLTMSKVTRRADGSVVPFKKQQVKFQWGKTKVDRRTTGNGACLRMRCSCIPGQKFAELFTLCPVHTCGNEELELWGKISVVHLRQCLYELLFKVGWKNEVLNSRHEYSLYSLRIGGCRSALLSGETQETVLRLGRWASSCTSLHYQGASAVDCEEDWAFRWPLVRVVVVD